MATKRQSVQPLQQSFCYRRIPSENKTIRKIRLQGMGFKLPEKFRREGQELQLVAQTSYSAEFSRLPD